MATNDQKLLTFSLGEEGYGVSILKVKEIIGMLEITPVPKTPEFIKGVINLRGKIIPIMDLRIKFGMEQQQYDERTCIIVVEIDFKGVQKLLGVVVDMVSEVVTVSDDQIEPPPEYGKTAEHNFILGIGKIKERVVIILDIEEVFSCEEVLKMLENNSQTIKE
ncbi:MAG: chemotaxis protein CheW [Candidatus Gastranaerophilales bacterium]|nr:chemotaxis protein CheW [Candidatus Gastranaerophilales bacterium]